jgi:hypothetical protein
MSRCLELEVEDIEKIMKYGVMITPAVVIDGDVKIVGKVPDEKEIKKDCPIKSKNY